MQYDNVDFSFTKETFSMAVAPYCQFYKNCNKLTLKFSCVLSMAIFASQEFLMSDAGQKSLASENVRHFVYTEQYFDSLNFKNDDNHVL